MLSVCYSFSDPLISDTTVANENVQTGAGNTSSEISFDQYEAACEYEPEERMSNSKKKLKQQFEMIIFKIFFSGTIRRQNDFTFNSSGE